MALTYWHVGKRADLETVLFGYFLRRATALDLGNYLRSDHLPSTSSSHIHTLLYLDWVFKITGTYQMMAAAIVVKTVPYVSRLYILHVAVHHSSYTKTLE